MSARFSCSLWQRPDITAWRRKCIPTQHAQNTHCALSFCSRLWLFYILILININKSVRKIWKQNVWSEKTNKQKQSQSNWLHQPSGVTMCAVSTFFYLGVESTGKSPPATSHVNSLLTSFGEATKHKNTLWGWGMRANCLVENIWQLNYALSHMAW